MNRNTLKLLLTSLFLCLVTSVSLQADEWLDAAKHGDVNALQGLLESGHPLLSAELGKHVWRTAASLKEIAVFEWLLANNFPGKIDEHGVDPWALAAGRANIALLEHLKAKKYPLHLEGVVVWRSAASNADGYLSFPWLHNNKVPGMNAVNEIGENLALLAATYDRVDALMALDRLNFNDWLVPRVVEGSDEDIFDVATEFGSELCLFWLARRLPNAYAAKRAQLLRRAKEYEQPGIAELLKTGKKVLGTLDPNGRLK